MQLRFNPPRHPLPSLSIAMKILTGFLLFTNHPSFFSILYCCFFLSRLRFFDSFCLSVVLQCDLPIFIFLVSKNYFISSIFFFAWTPVSLFDINIFFPWLSVLCSLSVLMPLLIPKFGTQISLWKVHIDHSCMCR